MNRDFINLLPQERRRKIRLDYFLRLGIVAALFVVILSVISAALLLPTYVFLTVSASTKEAQLANIEETLSSSDEIALSARLTALSNDSANIIAMSSKPSVMEVIRSVLAIPRPGILLSGISYSSSSEKNQKKLLVSGSSATRDSLRNYQLALRSASFARSANLPISAFAKDSEIDFTITVDLAP